MAEILEGPDGAVIRFDAEELRALVPAPVPAAPQPPVVLHLTEAAADLAGKAMQAASVASTRMAEEAAKSTVALGALLDRTSALLERAVAREALAEADAERTRKTLAAGLGDIAAAIRAMPAPVVNVAAPVVHVTIPPEAIKVAV